MISIFRYDINIIRNFKLFSISINIIQIIINIIQVLEPFKGATEILGGEKYVTSSITGQVLKSLLTSLNVAITDNTLTKNLKKANYDDLMKRKDNMGSAVSKAAALDPRYKALKFLTEEEKYDVWKELELEIESQTGTNNISLKSTKPNLNEDVVEPKHKKMRSLLEYSDDKIENDTAEQ